MGKDLNGNNLGKGFSQRKDGRYEARAVINGRKIDLYNSIVELKKSFKRAKIELIRDDEIIKDGTTLQEWFNRWFESSKAPALKSIQSRRSYKKKCENTFIKLIGIKKITEITQINIQDVVNDLLLTYSPKNIREATGVMKECFDAALANHIILSNPVVGIVVKEANNTPRERRVLTMSEQRIFLEEIAGTYYEEAYKILLLTGMRIGEFSGLQWSDVDFDNKCVHIRRQMQTVYLDGEKHQSLTTPKTSNSYRSIPFFDETEDLFKSWKNKQYI